MALGTLQLDAQKQPRRGSREGFRLAFVDLVKEAGHFAGSTPPEPASCPLVIGLDSGGLGDQLADETIVGEIVLQASLQPLLRLGAEDGRAFGIDPGEQPRSPDIGEMSGEGVRFAGGLSAVEQHFDPDLTLVRPAVIEEVAGVDDGWNAAGQVEVHVGE